MKITLYGIAQSILGADFITPEEVTEARPSIVYTVGQITELTQRLPSESVLRWCNQNGYAVMPAPPAAMSLIDVREIKPSHFISNTGGWYANRKFARKEKTSFGWILIKKTPVSNSTSRNWSEQKRLLSKIEKVPNAVEMSWFITTYFEVRGVRLFEDVQVRTSSLGPDGHHVVIGFFDDDDGLMIDHYDNRGRPEWVGLSACMK